MFKKTVILAFLALALAAFASSIDVANSGRTISGNSSGLFPNRLSPNQCHPSP
jgi:hypothetical protein